MKRIIDKTFVISTIICLLPTILILAMYDKLPQQIPIHFDTNGNADGFTDKFYYIFFPSLMAAINVITNIGLNTDPKRESSPSIVRSLGKWIVPVLSCVIVSMTMLQVLGVDVRFEIIIPMVVGVLFIVMGNYMPKCKQSYTVGIKIPWTLNDEENWNKTHRFAGFLWVLGGIVFIIGAFFKITYIIIGVLIVITIVPMIYSFLLYRKKEKARKS